MATDLTQLTAVELARRLHDRDVSAEEVVSAHLDRVDDIDTQVNAIVSRRPRDEVLADARAADRAGPTGRLHGLPVAVKDLEDVAGLPTRAGSTTTSDEPAAHDGLVAERLRAAGAIIIGKTNTPEFGTGSHTFNEVFGLTRNPWNLARSAGGSSGGAAAALAARMLPIADGSDLGGSLRNPAGFCNVVGMRPSVGRVPTKPVRSSHLLRLGVQGPMGRTVADTALVMAALAGPHPGDPLSWPDDPDDFVLGAPEPVRARIAWAGDLGLFVAEPQVIRVCGAALDVIEGAGGRVTETAPDLSCAERIFRVLRGLQYRVLGTEIPEARLGEVKDTVRANIEYGRSLTVEDVLDAERARAALHRIMASFFAEHDLLALPTSQVAPFPAEWDYPTEVAGRPMDDYLSWMMACCLITATGCPAISVPAGFTDDGLPVGLQLVAPVGADADLLRAAQSVEAALPYYREVPSLTYR